MILQSILEWYQVFSSISIPILQQPTNLTSYVNSVWLKDLINLMFKNDISIETKEYFQPKKQRKNDKCLMVKILKRDFNEQKK